MGMSFVFLLFGLATGSFLNVCINRLPKVQALLQSPFRCQSCGHTLAVPDLIPVLSYLLRRGRCLYCGAPIPYRVLLVELATGLLFVLLWYHYGKSLQLALALTFICLFIIIFFIDLEHHLVLNRVVYPAIFIALIAAPLTHFSDIVKPLLGGLVGAGVPLLVAVIFPRGMGLGDVKLGAFVGLVVGFPQVFVSLFISFVLAGIASIGLILMKRKRRQDYIPFAPFLTVGGVVAMLYGIEIWRLYLGS